MSYKSVALGLSPKGLWMFDEASGTTINDTSGNSQNGTFKVTGVTLGVASLISNPGGNGTAASFTSTTAGDFLGSIPNSATIALTSFTFVMWFKFTGSVVLACPVAMDGETTLSNGFEIARTSGANTSRLIINTSTSGGQVVTVSSPLLFDGGVHMMACGVSGTSFYQSIDAGTYQSATFTGSYSAPTVDLAFGNDIPAENALNAVGTYQGAAMFTGQLSQANLTSLYNAGLGIGISPAAIFSHRHRTQIRPRTTRAKHAIFFRPLWKLPLSPPQYFPPNARRRQQKKRTPLVKAKQRVRNRWITERQVTAPHADFPEQLRRQQQKHRVPRVKAKPALRTRWISERQVTAPPQYFPANLRHGRISKRIPRVKAKHAVRSAIELYIPPAPAIMLPPALRRRQQAKRIPHPKAKRIVRSNLELRNSLIPLTIFPPELRRRAQPKRARLVKARRRAGGRIFQPPQAQSALPRGSRAHRQRRRMMIYGKRTSLMMVMGRAVIVTVTGDIARWRFQRRNIGVQGRVRSSSKHGDV